MKVEVSAPSNRAKRDFRFEAFVKRVIIYHNDFPQFSKVFYTIVENPIGTIMYAGLEKTKFLGSVKPNADGTFLICYQKQG